MVHTPASYDVYTYYIHIIYLYIVYCVMIIIMMVGYMYHILRHRCYFYGHFMIHHMMGLCHAM